MADLERYSKGIFLYEPTKKSGNERSTAKFISYYWSLNEAVLIAAFHIDSIPFLKLTLELFLPRKCVDWLLPFHSVSYLAFGMGMCV